MSYKATAIIEKEKYRTVISAGKHQIISDEPEELGGKDTGFQPAEILSAALSACTSATIKAYADRKGWDLQRAIVEVEFETEQKEKWTTYFTKKIEFVGNLDEAQRSRLLEVAGKCPLHKILTNPIEIITQQVNSKK